MDTTYRQILRKIKNEFGEAVFEDVRQFKALSNDLAPKMKRETILMMAFIEIGGYKRLKRDEDNKELVKNSLFRQLVDEYSINHAAAKWCVEMINDIMNDRMSQTENLDYLLAAETEREEGEKRAALSQAVSSEDKRKPLGKTNQKPFKNQPKLESFKDVKLSVSPNHIAYITPKGEIGAFGHNSDGRCDISHLTDGAAIASGLCHTAVLRRNGLVYARGNNDFSQCETGEFRGITQLVCGDYYTAGLKRDGTVAIAGGDIDEIKDCATWRDVVKLYGGSTIIAGIDQFGNVLTSGDNAFGHLDTYGYKNITQLAIGPYHMAMLKKNGMVAALGENMDGQCNVSSLMDIDEICVGMFHTVAVNRGGKVFGMGDNSQGQIEVDDLRGIKTLYGGETYTIAIDRKGKSFLVGEFPLWREFLKSVGLS